MGTYYYLRNQDGDFFDLDKSYGLATLWLPHGRLSSDPFRLPDRAELLALLAEHQELPCCHEREAWADRMIQFAHGGEVTMHNEQDDIDYSGRVVGDRWTEAAMDHCRTCIVAEDYRP